jgi:hypothetical protein
MKKIFASIAVLAILLACNNNAQTDKAFNDSVNKLDSIDKIMKDSASFTTIEWIDSVNQDLGQLEQGKEVEITWRFKNAGKTNLIIEAVSASCGCTVPEKPEGIITPGQEAVIKAKFNGSGLGPIAKQVHVSANTLPSNQITLGFTGEVINKNEKQ